MKPSKDFEKVMKRKEKYLVLEVGNYNTKLIEVESQAGKIIVSKGFIIATPEGAIKDDIIVRNEELIQQLDEKIKEEKITSRQVTISLSSGDIITREMPVPKMSTRDTLSFIKVNAKDLFPIDLEDYTLGYVSMGKEENSKLLIIAIPNELIIPYIEITEKLGLVLKSINFSGFELYNLIDFELGRSSGSYAVIDLGSKNTNFIIVSNGMLMYNRVLKTGSDDITKAIADKFKCTLTKAEKIKRDYNSVITEGYLKQTDDVYIVAEIIQDVIHSLLSDVSSIIEYYNQNHTRNTVSRVYIIGLATKISGICEFVESVLGIRTEKIKEFERVLFEDAAKAAKRRQVTLENCLGAVPVDDKKVNLIKGNLQLAKFYQSINPIVYEVGILVCCLMVLALCIINFSTYKINEKTEEYKAYVAENKELIEVQNDYNKIKNQLQTLKKLSEDIPDGKENAYKLLEYLQEALMLNPNISLTSCTISSDKFIKISFSTPDSDSAINFDDSLRDYFSFPRSFYNVKENKKEFSLDLTLKEELQK